MRQGILRDTARGTQSGAAARFQLAVISDQPGAGEDLHDAFEVVRIPFAGAEARLASLRCQVALVDAREEPRLREVSRIALGGMRGVVVMGPPQGAEGIVRYLDVGASDYVTPESTRAELLARLRSVARTSYDVQDDTLVCGAVTISLRRREVRRHGEVVHLTPNEYAVLEALARSPGELVSHRQLMASVWGPENATSRHYLRLYVRQLREKLEDDSANPSLIVTEWGVGYRLSTHPELESGRASA